MFFFVICWMIESIFLLLVCESVIINLSGWWLLIKLSIWLIVLSVILVLLIVIVWFVKFKELWILFWVVLVNFLMVGSL